MYSKEEIDLLISAWNYGLSPAYIMRAFKEELGVDIDQQRIRRLAYKLMSERKLPTENDRFENWKKEYYNANKA